MDNIKPKLSLEYIAGYMDGEGTFSMVKHTDKNDGYLRFNTKISVGSTYKPILEQIQNILGGHLYERKQTVNKKFYSLEWGKRSDVITVCEFLIPYLYEKKKQAEILLEFCKKREKKFLKTKNNRYNTYESSDLEMYYLIKDLKYA